MRTTRSANGGCGRTEPGGANSRPFGGCRAVLCALFGLFVGACTAVQQIPDEPERAYLKLEVAPASTEVYVDGDYRGTVEGWVRGAVPLEPGDHRVKLRADGYITRRFDVRVQAGESRVLELEMERRLETLSADAGSESPPPDRPRDPRHETPLEAMPE